MSEIGGRSRCEDIRGGRWPVSRERERERERELARWVGAAVRAVQKLFVAAGEQRH